MGDEEPKTLADIYQDLLGPGEIALNVLAVRIGKDKDRFSKVTVGAGYGLLEGVVSEAIEVKNGKRTFNYVPGAEADDARWLFSHAQDSLRLQLLTGKEAEDLKVDMASRKAQHPHLPYGAVENALVGLVSRMVPARGFPTTHPSGR